MKFDLLKFFELSARTAFAVLVACILLLFFPAQHLPFDIGWLRKEHGIWIFVLMVISISVISSYILKWICDFIKKKYEIYKTWSLYKSIISGLSDKEKIFLKEKYSKNETTLMIDWQSPIHKHLQTLGIISMNAGTSVGNPNALPGFIQPWVFETIKKNPKIIDK